MRAHCSFRSLDRICELYGFNCLLAFALERFLLRYGVDVNVSPSKASQNDPVDVIVNLCIRSNV